MPKLIRLLIPLLILAMGWFGYAKLSVQEEKKRRPPPEARVIRTEVLELRREDYPTRVRTQGVVRAHREAVLAAQVNGKVLEISPGLEDGAFFAKGDVLVSLDEEDFQGAIISAQANLARAQATAAQEETKAKQARLNWEDLGYQEEPNELVLRLPQLREAKAGVLAAEASLASAERDLRRASVRAPFSGRVLRRSVSIGQSVSPTTTLATVFSTESVNVRLPIPARDLAFLQLPESSADEPVKVILRDALTPGSTTTWEGLVTGTEGQLDPDSRELFAIARVDDPFSLKPGTDRPPLRIGQPVLAEINGRVLEDVIEIPRSAVEDLDRIHLVDPETLLLSRRQVDPVWSDETTLLIRDETIPDGMLLSVSKLAFAPEGQKVEILESEVEVEADPESEAEPKAGGTEDQ